MIVDTLDFPMNIVLEAPEHAAAIETLLDSAFGLDRHRKTSYRLRDGVAPITDLCLVATGDEGELLGTLRFWPVSVAGVGRVLLLGPIAVINDQRSTGIGTRLMQEGLARAKAAGWQAVILVGDEPYYARFGFSRTRALGLAMPGPVDPARFLALDLVEGALDRAEGMVLPVDGVAVVQAERLRSLASGHSAPLTPASVSPHSGADGDTGPGHVLAR